MIFPLVPLRASFLEALTRFRLPNLGKLMQSGHRFMVSRQVLVRSDVYRVSSFKCNPGSPLIHLRISGKSTIVINSARAAIDLLEARSNIYSDRPRSQISTSSPVPSQNAPASIASRLLRPFTWIFTPWSPRAILGDRPTIFSTSVMHPRFRKYRKLLQTSLNPRAVRKYTSLMEQERLVMLRGMLQHPEDFVRHVRR